MDGQTSHPKAPYDEVDRLPTGQELLVLKQHYNILKIISSFWAGLAQNAVFHRTRGTSDPCANACYATSNVRTKNTIFFHIFLES